MNESASSKPTVTIKKYANRRLYNTATSTYVTLEALSAMVREGIEFNVYDAKTSEDITRSVLTQIIVEEEGKSGQPNLLPISFLRQLIGFYGDSMQWMVPKYLEHSMQTLSNNQEPLRDYFQTAFGNLFPFSSTLEEMGKQNLAMFENAMRLFTPFSACEQEECVYEEPAECACTRTAPPEEPKAKVEVKSYTPAPAPVPTPAPVQVQTPPPPPVQAAAPVQAPPPPVQVAAPVQVQAPPPAPVPEPVTASVTNIIRRAEPAPVPVVEEKPVVSKPAPAPKSTPMPNVKSATAAAAALNTDDMQQKIANLQRQLADLAKNRA
jgi:polyhydroxyalkanoate synthesis repressor PhaR